MKPAPPRREGLMPRSVRSLYAADNTKTVKRDSVTTKLPCRKTTFKPPSTNVRLNKSLIQSGTIRRRTEAGFNRNDSLKMIQGMDSKTTTKKCPEMLGFFLRPYIDVRSARQRFMERAKRMENLFKSDEGNSKFSNQTVTTPAIPCTPKPSGLSMALIKLSNYKKKVNELEREKLTPSVKKKKINFDNNGDDGDHADLSNQTMANKGNISSQSTENHLSNNKENDEGNRYPLKNVLHQMQDYFSEMLRLNNEIDSLDEKFRSVMVANIDHQFYETFLNYQNKKKALYKGMQLLEEKLENSVQIQFDIRLNFEKYLRNKKNILKERNHLNENYEKSLKKMIFDYENESGKSTKCENVEEIMKSLITKDDQIIQPVLRRSKRLSSTPRNNPEMVKNSRRRKDSRENEELIVKRGRRSSASQRVQMNMYKDLQKSFNLCSPECSF